MNKEELRELAATLNGIADGKAWERTNSITGEWCDPDHCGPELCSTMGRKIRLKPWSLPPPPDGMQWHRDDWTEDMLDGGWRPHLLGEVDNGDEEYLSYGMWRNGFYGSLKPTTARDDHRRTKAPLPQPDPYAEIKAAHAAGKKLQCKMKLSDAWLDFPGDFSNLDSRYEVRIKPEQQKVPLGPGDVPPGSWISLDCEHLAAVIAVSPSSLSTADTTRSWKELMDDSLQINRSIPLTGKWNPEAWEPCYKLIDTP